MTTTSTLRALLRAAAANRAQPCYFDLEPLSLAPFLDGVRKTSRAPFPTIQGQWDLSWASTGLAHLLPTSLRETVEGIYRAENSPCVILRGIPVPDANEVLVRSPLLDELDEEGATQLFPSLALHAAIGSFAGKQYTFLEERGENAFHLVMPARNSPAESQSSVSANAVNFHTECPIPPVEVFQPRALCLLMVRPQPGVQTALTTLDELAHELLSAPPLLIETLASPRFRHPAPDVVRIMGGDRTSIAEDAYDPTKGRPILYIREDPLNLDEPMAAMILCEETDALDPDDHTAKDAVATLLAKLSCLATKYDLNAGEMLVWANQRAAHGRIGTLKPHYDGFDRLLVRSFHHPSPPAMVVREYMTEAA